MKKISVILLSLTLVFCSFSGVCAAEYDPPEDVYVADFADVIETSVENHIISTGQELYELTGAQVVVVTIDFANGDMEDAAYEIFNDWGIGDPTLNNGILILMSIGDQDAWVMQGAGLERDLPASTISDMMDYYLADYFFDGEYSKGAESIFDAFVDWLCEYYGVELNAGGNTPGTNTPVYQPQNNNNNYSGNYNNNESSGIPWGLIIFIIIVIIIIRNSRKKRRYYSGGSSYGRAYRAPRVIYTPRPRNNNQNYNNRPSSGSSIFGGGSSSGSRPSKPNSFGGGRSRGGGSSFSSGRSSSSSRSSFRSSSSRSSSRGGSFGGGKSRGGGGGFGKR